jgi:hypothetical protein
MLQALLTDRFRLAFHRETRELTASHRPTCGRQSPWSNASTIVAGLCHGIFDRPSMSRRAGSR